MFRFRVVALSKAKIHFRFRRRDIVAAIKVSRFRVADVSKPQNYPIFGAALCRSGKNVSLWSRWQRCRQNFIPFSTRRDVAAEKMTRICIAASVETKNRTPFSAMWHMACGENGSLAHGVHDGWNGWPSCAMNRRRTHGEVQRSGALDSSTMSRKSQTSA